MIIDHTHARNAKLLSLNILILYLLASHWHIFLVKLRFYKQTIEVSKMAEYITLRLIPPQKYRHKNDVGTKVS
jgi:hypothetical protein